MSRRRKGRRRGGVGGVGIGGRKRDRGSGEGK